MTLIIEEEVLLNIIEKNMKNTMTEVLHASVKATHEKTEDITSKVFYKTGDRFEHQNGCEYILISVPEKLGYVCMTNIETGDYRGKGMRNVIDSRQITDDEFRQICAGDKYTRI